MKFESVTADPELSKSDTVVLNCHVHSYSNIRSNVTVELTDVTRRRLTSETYSLLSSNTSIQYDVNVTSSVSGPFHCIVTASVISMETVSNTLTAYVLGEFFQHISFARY